MGTLKEEVREAEIKERAKYGIGDKVYFFCDKHIGVFEGEVLDVLNSPRKTHLIYEIGHPQDQHPKYLPEEFLTTEKDFVKVNPYKKDIQEWVDNFFDYKTELSLEDIVESVRDYSYRRLKSSIETFITNNKGTTPPHVPREIIDSSFKALWEFGKINYPNKNNQ